MKNRSFLILLVVLVGLAFVGCMATPEGGSIRVSLDSRTSRSLEPSISMVCEAYQVTVTDSSLAVIYDQEVTADVTVDGLLPDTYSVTVVGKNASGTALGEGSGSAAVTVGTVTPCSIVITEYIGNGTLDLTTTWPVGVVNDPNVVSTIQKGIDPADPMTWTVDTVNNQAVYFNDVLSNGWYSVVFKLYDNGAADPSAGFATLARVVKDQTTSGTISLNPNAATGGIEILVDQDFHENLNVVTDFTEGAYDIANPQTINLSTPDYTGTVLYSWYENGVAVDSTSSYTIDTTALTIGNTYRYDCIAISDDGKAGASLTWVITVTENTVTFLWEPSSCGTPDIQIAHFLDGDAENETTIVTDNDGEFVLYDLPVGDYALRLRSTDNLDMEYLGGDIYTTYALGNSAFVADFGIVGDPLN